MISVDGDLRRVRPVARWSLLKSLSFLSLMSRSHCFARSDLEEPFEETLVDRAEGMLFELCDIVRWSMLLIGVK